MTEQDHKVRQSLHCILITCALRPIVADVHLEFHGLDPDIMLRSLNVLVKQGKAQVFGNEGQEGVKFF